MRLSRIGSTLNRNERNNLNDNFDVIEQNFGKVLTDSNEAKEIAKGIDGKVTQALATANHADNKSMQAVETSNQALETSEDAMTLAESVRTEFDQIVIEGDSSVEAAQARVSADDTVYSTLKARLDVENVRVTQQLAQTDEDLDQRGLNVKMRGVGVLDDDTALLNSLISNEGYKEVQLPNGVYNIKGEVILNGRKKLIGIGDVTIILDGVNACIKLINSFNTIENIRIVAKEGGIRPNAAIVGDSTHSNTFRNLFINGTKEGIVFNFGCWLQNINEVTIQNCDVGIHAKHEFNNVVLIRVDCSHCGDGILLDTVTGNGGSHGVQFVSCRFELNTGYGLRIYQTGHFNLTGCYFERNAIADVQAYNALPERRVEVLSLNGCTFISDTPYAPRSIISSAINTYLSGCRFVGYLTNAVENHDILTYETVNRHNVFSIGNTFVNTPSPFRVPRFVYDTQNQMQAINPRKNYSYVASNTTLTFANNFVNVSAVTGNISITLPLASTVPHGTFYEILKSDSSQNTVTFSAQSGDSIINNQSISQQYEKLTIIKANNTQWLVY